MNEVEENGSVEYPTPLDSSTVILIRDRSEGQYEIFLMRRHKKQDFMAGAFVFPGGRLDEEDCDVELAQCACEFPPETAKEKLNEPDISDERALGLFFAAVRETFEEAGVLLAYSPDGKLISFTGDKTEERFAEYREKVHEKKISLKELAGKENICYALDLLTPYSRWVTPEPRPKRFDTRFLIARIPEGQSPVHCNIEMTQSLWITPSEAIKQQEAGKILLMPPTMKTIHELNEFNKADELFGKVSPRDIFTILPQPFEVDGGFGVKLPHDPEYTIDGYKQPEQPEKPSRVVFQNGEWRIINPHSKQ